MWISTSESRGTWSHVTLLRIARFGERLSEEHLCARVKERKKERERTEGEERASKGMKKQDRSNNRRARSTASVAINSMLTTIISERSNEAAGRQRNRVPSLSLLSPLVHSRIYLRNYLYDDYDRARARLFFDTLVSNAISSASLSFTLFSILSL